MRLTPYSLKAAGMGLLLAFTTLNGCKTDLSSTEPKDEKQTSVSNVTNYIHPGIINTQQSLDWLKTNVGGRTQAFGKVTSWISTHKSSPFVNKPLIADPSPKTVPADYPNKPPGFLVDVIGAGTITGEEFFKKDAILAYACALSYVANPDLGKANAHADTAIKILKNYGKYFVDFDPVDNTKDKTQARLVAAWVAPTFVAAAEIMKDYSKNGAKKWTNSSEINDFRNFVLKLHNNENHGIKRILPDAPNGQGKKGNWGLSAAYAKMAIGVYLDEFTSVYNDGRAAANEIMELEIAPGNTIANLSGQVGDFCNEGFNTKECRHGQYSLSAITFAAEIARNQGEGGFLYNQKYGSSGNPRLMLGYYWMKQYFTDPDFVEGTCLCPDPDASSCFKCTNFSDIWPGAEVASDFYNHPSWLETLISQHAEGPNDISSDFNFLGFTTFTHRGNPY